MKQIIQPDIYQMDLHDEISTPYCKILRVAGGWIYTLISDDGHAQSSVFVPFDNQFMVR
jgi:hypothetical protein